MILTPGDSVFVIVDIQGRLARLTHECDTLFANVGILVRGMRLLGVPILVTEQYPKGLGHTVEEVAREITDIPIIEKMAFSCCGESAFMDALQATRRRNVILCGIETHVCVYQTARDLIGLGYTPWLVTDAVSSRTPANKQLGIHRIESMGAVLTGVEMVLFELLHESGTENFKAISKMLK